MYAAVLRSPAPNCSNLNDLISVMGEQHAFKNVKINSDEAIQNQI